MPEMDANRFPNHTRLTRTCLTRNPPPLPPLSPPPPPPPLPLPLRPLSFRPLPLSPLSPQVRLANNLQDRLN